MKVGKLIAPRQIEITDEIEPYARDIGDVLIKVESVGICGSDLHYFRHGGLGSFRSLMPMEMCHEVSGVVETSLSPYFKKGDKVAIEPGKPCRACKLCYEGRTNLCTNGSFIGAGTDGALRESIIVHYSQLVKSQRLTFDELMLTEPLGVALHAWLRSSHNLLEKIAIFGIGPIGLLIGAVGKVFGVGDIYFTDRLYHREEFAQDFLGSIARNKLNHPKEKFDITYETGGEQETIDWSYNYATAGGQVVLVGIPEVDYIQYNPHIARIKELDIINTRRAHDTLHQCVKLVEQGSINLKSMVTHKFHIEDAQKAFEIAADYKDNVMKTVIVP